MSNNSGLLLVANNNLYDLPVPINLSWWWVFGSQLGACLAIQIVSGVLLSFHYNAGVDNAFDSVVHIVRNVNNGWLLRSIHANGASVFFMCLYVHIGRGLYYGSCNIYKVWLLGVLLYLLVMASAFLGYVLPWGQMSYWGATVITSLLTAVPYVGETLTFWVWGGFSVGEATLIRFYSLHFILPGLLAVLSGLHLYFLHECGSGNPLGVSSEGMSVRFHPFSVVIDLVGLFGTASILLLLSCFFPDLLSNPSNWFPADSLVTPLHIEPEWYFLFAYSILRCIPNNVGGVIGLVMGVCILFFCSFLHSGKFNSMSFYPLSQLIFWGVVFSLALLTWLGSCLPEGPYDLLSQVGAVAYFVGMCLMYLAQAVWDWVIN